MEILELIDAKAALELADTIKSMASVIFSGNAPKIVTNYALVASVTHSLHVQERCAREFGAELS
jgi:hypothetical protein